MTGDAIEPGVERTGRWRGIGAAALLAGALGLVGRQPALLLVGAAGVALLAYARLVPPPALGLSLHRTTRRREPHAASDGAGQHPAGERTSGASERTAEEGERIEVTLTVENTTGRTIPELRLLDGVPAGLPVVEGSPRIGTTLRPGETATCTYTLETRPGRHEFEPASAVARDVAGVVERRDRIAVDDGAVEAASGATLSTSVPTRSRPTRFVGEDAGTTGEGVTFEGVRSYRHGDPPGRIDWRRLARTGELSTITYREERGVSVVLVIDARRAAAYAPAPDAPTAIERSLAAATALVEELAASGRRVGIARLGPERRWLPPGQGAEHGHRATELLAERPPSLEGDRGGADVAPAEPAADREWLRERLPARAEVVCLSPATDDAIVDCLRHLDADSVPVTVLSPDPTDDATPGRRLARIERRHRLRSLRSAGVRVVDWPPGRALDDVVRRMASTPGVEGQR